MPVEASRRDLILTTSFGYSFEQLYPFLQSLKETGFDGEIVFFVGGTSIPTINRLRAWGVKLVPFFYPFKHAHKMRNPLYRCWPLVRRFFARCKSAATLACWSAPFQNIVSLRFLLYYRFLRSRPDRYGNIFISDVRDVSFQASPFLRAQPGKLRFFVEEPPRTIGTCPVNSQWIRESFGPEVLEQLSAQPISCAGTTLGDYPSIVTYLERFILTLPSLRSVMRVGFDQGVHNYLARTELNSLVIFCPNRTSEVLTMGMMPRDEDFPRNGHGQLIDAHGEPYAVLHQFDRHEQLAREILGRYQLHGHHSG